MPADTPPAVRKPRKRAAAKSVTTADVHEMLTTFATQAEEIGSQSQRFQDEWVKTVAAENITFKRRNKVLVRFAAIIAVLSVVMASALGYQLYRSIYQTGPILSRLDHQTEGIDSLTEFVREVRDASCDPRTRDDCPPDPAQMIVRILCASTNPVRLAACKEVTKAAPG